MSYLKNYKLSAIGQDELQRLIVRNVDPLNSIQEKVIEILEAVRQGGDAALLDFSKKFDQVDLSKLVVDQDDIQAIAMNIGRNQQRALEIAFGNIHKFHSVQNRRERSVETMPGVKCWRENRPIEKVGLYIPGGSANLPSTLLMLGVPARIAGCKEIVVCSPPQKDGKINPYLAYCLHLLKIDKVYLTGGAQAIGAMAYGTETIPKVDKIFGPGNQFVTKAKSIVQTSTQVAIDLPAGPSEVLIIADSTSNPAYIAADLLAQAEHGPDSQVVLVSTDEPLIDQVNKHLENQLEDLPRAGIARQALSQSFSIFSPDLKKAIGFSNLYAPEHLIIAVEDFQPLISQISNAGSVFLGPLSAESFGDYASGTNHTLPTSGFAKSYSGVSVDSFIKKITFQTIRQEGLTQLGPIVEILAGLEGLEAHKRSVSIRLAAES